MKVSVAIAKQGIGYDIFGLISQAGLKGDTLDLICIRVVGIDLRYDAVVVNVQAV